MRKMPLYCSIFRYFCPYWSEAPITIYTTILTLVSQFRHLFISLIILNQDFLPETYNHFPGTLLTKV